MKYTLFIKTIFLKHRGSERSKIQEAVPLSEHIGSNRRNFKKTEPRPKCICSYQKYILLKYILIKKSVCLNNANTIKKGHHSLEWSISPSLENVTNYEKSLKNCGSGFKKIYFFFHG